MSEQGLSESENKLSVGQWVYRSLLLIAGWVFFVIKDPAALIWIFGITFLGYAVGIELEKRQKTGDVKNTLIYTVVVITAILIVFKYGGLFLGHGLLVPLGLSYYSLMVIGYLIDVYRGDVRAENNIIVFALYVGFLPQITAGPIGRGKELLKIYRNRITVSVEDIKVGLLMITLGVFEKFAMADNLRGIVDGIVASDAGGVTLAVAFLFFSLVIYYDFAGYSLIAIGLGRLMGVKLTDNFHAPYLATSVKEFWRRWHISLSSWFRDYLYIPLGGSRKGKIRRDLNTILVFAVSGAWHGQQIGFWIWGLVHGIFLVVENGFRALFGSKTIRLSKAIRIPLNMGKRFVVFALVSFAWIPFYAGSLDNTVSLFGRLFSKDDGLLSWLSNGFGLRVEIWALLGIGFILFLVLSILDEWLKHTLYERIAKRGYIIFILAIVLYTALLLIGAYGSEYEAAEFIYGGF